MLKNLPLNQETWVQSLGWDDLLEEEMATQSSILAWKIPQTEEPGRLWSMGFSRQEYWSGLPFPPPGDRPGPGIEPASPVAPSLAGRLFTTGPPVKPMVSMIGI